MMNKIDIPQNKFDTIFQPITLNIVLKDKSASIQYYLHRCQNTEFKEITSNEAIEQSINHLETIYFLNEDQETSTLQINSKRTDEKSEQEVEPQSDKPTTLYFINEEES